MARNPLGPPPFIKQEPAFDRWMRLLWQRVVDSNQIIWSQVDSTGSNLTDIATRNHADLQNINTASYTHLTSANHTDLTDGGATTLHKHDHAAQDNLNSESYCHLTQANHTDLTDGGDSTLHYHAADRALGNATGTLAIGNGGTGQTTANAALNALLPSQATHSGKALITNGTDTAWTAVTSGTVTSVALTMPTGFSVSGSPVTSSGTLAVTTTLNGILKGDGLGAITTATASADYAPATSGGAILKGNGTGGFSSAAAGTDYQAPIGTISGIAKGNGANALTAATAGTDYESPIAAGTTAQYWRGDKSWQTLDKSAVGLGSVENTALSTWAGSTNITTLGTIATGVWSGTAIAANKLTAMVGDSGAGGTQGAAPAPASGDAAAGKFLKADGTWAVPPSGAGGSRSYAARH